MLQDKALLTEISEIFSSLQGEGPYIGKKQIFMRFGRCNMHCHYCDELDKMQAEKFETMTLKNVLGQIHDFQIKEGQHHSVSLTGGEPLFYSKFLESFLPEVKKMGLKTYLETNGTLPTQLQKHIDLIDIVAMDMKPPSSTKDKAYWKQHEAFLKIAIQKELFVKVVITPETLPEEVFRSIRMVKEVSPSIPFVFQPLSEQFGISLKALQLIQNQMVDYATQYLDDVRVIPQMHKVWGVR